MSVILAIDPGSSESAWLAYDTTAGMPRSFAKVPNQELLEQLRDGERSEADIVVIEWMQPRGMPTSAQEFETLYWIGRFAEAAHPRRVDRVTRLSVKRHLCGNAAAKDANIRAALIDRFGGIGGSAAAIGLKASPGPLYGVAKDVWAALAVAVTWADRERGLA